jgi:two-component system sensor histidine kinase/response regulator
MQANNYKILIVDDVPKNIQILANILSKEGYEIAYANQGEQALDILQHQAFDLILLDVMMPGKNGFEVCKILKSQKSTKDIPIIFLTAKAEMENIIQGFKVGGHDYITKPFNQSELLARTKTHIQLNEQKKALHNLNLTLEDKVAERTRELEKAYAQLGALEKTKTEFLSIISHELRTPLNGMNGLTTLLEQTELNKQQKEYLKYLGEVSKRLARFSDIALLITSLKVNKYEPSLISTAVSYLIEMAVESYNENHKNEPAKIKIEAIPKDLMIEADADLIRKSLELLLENAVKYGGYKNEITLQTTINNNQLIISCIDHGPGFNKASLEHTFQLFSTGDLMHEEGAGLSLAAIKLIMDFHHGEITIENQKSGGAMVSLKFPYS